MTYGYDRREAALLIALSLAISAITGAWFSQVVLGVMPCKLCLWQRWPYYIGIPAIIATILSIRIPSVQGLARLLALAAAGIFLASLVLGIYHAGIEWKFWTGPNDCAGLMFNSPASVQDFLKVAERTRVLRCDEAGGRVLGLSFAGWNAVVSALVAGFAVRGASSRS